MQLPNTKDKGVDNEQWSPLNYPSFGEVRAEVFFLVEGRGGRAGNLHLVVVVFQTSTLHVRVL